MFNLCRHFEWDWWKGWMYSVVYLRSAVITIAVIMTSDIATSTIMTVIEVSSVRK